MKFLCIECDEAMTLAGTRGPDRGSMTVVFACPDCGRQTAMLTNASETQVVRSLGVKIGGRTVEAEPMEGIREGLSHAGTEDASAGAVSSGGAMSSRGAHSSGSAMSSGSAHSSVDAVSAHGASKCPFTGMVNEAFERDEIAWSEAARTRVEKIPSYARSMVMKGVEEYAREEGLEAVTEAVLDRARGRLGM